MEDNEESNMLCIQDDYTKRTEQYQNSSFQPEMMKPLGEVFETTNPKVCIHDFLNMPNQENADRYIQSYFMRRSKEKLSSAAIVEADEGKFESRSIHMVSAFLLGCYIQRKMHYNYLSKTIRNQWSFEYLWFMCCLYHDAFSSTESTQDCSSISIDGILHESSENGKTYTIYDKSIYGVHLPTPTYQEKDVKIYFQYRLDNGRVDHGIKGGYVAFQKLVDNYMDARAENGNKDFFRTELKGKFKGQELLWDKKQIEAFAYIADAIIAHNIWHVSAEDEKKNYRERGMQKFIVGHNDKSLLTINDTPLAYFLSMIDTIEPVKWFVRNEAEIEEKVKMVFDNITIWVDKYCIILGQSDKKLFCLEKWHDKKMRNMPDWLYGVQTSYCKRLDIICIRFATTQT